MRTALLSLLAPFVRLMPETRLFGLKRAIYRICGADIAQGVRICSSVTILGAGKLVIGRDTWVGHQAMIICGGTVEIGSDVDIAPRVFIGTGTHHPGTSEKAAGDGVNYPVTIEDGCWIGAGSLILPGTTLARATTVGAGSVVTRDTTVPGTTIIGVPAREFSKRGAIKATPSSQGAGTH